MARMAHKIPVVRLVKTPSKIEKKAAANTRQCPHAAPGMNYFN